MNNLQLNCRSPVLGLAFAMALLGAGCASTPRPDAEMALSRNAVNEALTAGAAESAPLELQNARQKMARAEAAVAAEKYEEARRLAAEADLDARLAAARARTARANLAAVEIQKSIRALRDSLDTTNPAPTPITR